MKKTGQTRNDYYDDEEDFYFPFGGGGGSITVYEEPRPGPQFTGLLDSRGRPIFRVTPPKPPIGFSNDPDINYLFEFNPDTDFGYTSELVGVEEDETDEGDD